MKYIINMPLRTSEVAPVRERGLKSASVAAAMALPASRSREGAWIEMVYIGATDTLLLVAPVRERGLK